MDIRSTFRNYLNDVCHDGGTQEASPAYDWTCRFRHVGGVARQIRWLTFPEVPWQGRQGRKVGQRHAAEKSL